MASTDEATSSMSRIDRIIELIDETLDEVARSDAERAVAFADLAILHTNHPRAA